MEMLIQDLIFIYTVYSVNCREGMLRQVRVFFAFGNISAKIKVILGKHDADRLDQPCDGIGFLQLPVMDSHKPVFIHSTADVPHDIYKGLAVMWFKIMIFFISDQFADLLKVSISALCLYGKPKIHLDQPFAFSAYDDHISSCVTLISRNLHSIVFGIFFSICSGFRFNGHFLVITKLFVFYITDTSWNINTIQIITVVAQSD